MEKLATIKEYLDRELNIAGIDDYCANGLEVQGCNDVEKIVCLVDASAQGFDEAINRKANMIIVHHGLVFGSVRYLTGILYNRIKRLIKNDISLYAAHLPLDIHSVWGNNAQIAQVLDLQDVTHFDVDKYEQLMVIGSLSEPMSFDDLFTLIKDRINTASRCVQFSDCPIKKIAIISGSGSQAVEAAHQLGADVFLTGESKLEAYHTARELGISMIFAGHYYTEVFGVKALANHLAETFDVTAEFIDIPTEL